MSAMAQVLMSWYYCLMYYFPTTTSRLQTVDCLNFSSMNTDETGKAAQSASLIAILGSTGGGYSCLSVWSRASNVGGYGWESSFLKLKHLIKDMIFWDFAWGCLSLVLMMVKYTYEKSKHYFSYFTGFAQCYAVFLYRD